MHSTSLLKRRELCKHQGLLSTFGRSAVGMTVSLLPGREKGRDEGDAVLLLKSTPCMFAIKSSIHAIITFIDN